jgi:cell division protein FtsQ
MPLTGRPTTKRDRQSSPKRVRHGRRAQFGQFALRLTRTGRLPAFLLSVGLSVLLGAFALSDDFSVDTVIIRGNSIAYADSIVEQSGAIGESIFRIDTQKVAERVASHPSVESAEVRAELPDRVIVRVVEREPSVVWQAGERAVLVDEHGWVLARGEIEHAPRIVDLGGDLPSPGSQVPVELVAAAHVLMQEFGSTMTLEYDDVEGLTVYLPDDQIVALGSPDELPVKLQVVATVRDMGVDWTRLDVRDPERPYYQ